LQINPAAAIVVKMAGANGGMRGCAGKCAAVDIDAMRGVIAEAAFLDGHIIAVAGVGDRDAGCRIGHITSLQGANVAAAAGVDLDAVPVA